MWKCFEISLHDRLGSIARICLNLAVSLVAMLLGFCLLGALSTSIPVKSVAANTASSARQIQQLEAAWIPANPYLRDLHTDGWMLNIAVSGLRAETDSVFSPFKSFLDCRYFVWGDFTNSENAEFSALASTSDFKNNYPEARYYPRYWHGYQIPLRFFLCLTDLHGLKIFNYIMFFLLFGVSMWLVWRKVSARAAVCFGVVMCLSLAPIPGCMQYSTCYYIMFLSLIAFLLFPRTTRSVDNICVSMFVVGGLTAFMDLLVCPLITLGIPLALALSLSDCHADRHDRLRLVVAGIVGWFAGYGAVWASKWLICYAVTGADVFSDAAAQIKTRTFDLGDTGVDISVWLETFLPFVLLWACVLISVIKTRKDWMQIRENAYLLIVGAIPLAWFSVFVNHTLIHWVFVWRTLIVPTFCWSLFVWNVLRPLSSGSGVGLKIRNIRINGCL